MYLESNSRFVLFSSNDLLHFPLFFDDFSSWAILKKPIKNCQKIGREGIQKELSDNDVVDIYTFLPRHDFPCTF